MLVHLGNIIIVSEELVILVYISVLLVNFHFSLKAHSFFIRAVVRLMRRAASHMTLECSLQTHPNITIIGEEVINLVSSQLSQSN